MDHHTEQNDRPGQDIERDARQKLEAAEEATDAERLEVLERLYRDLEGALDS